jgi:16S rRNA (cytosine1402-N4)-methyltransferase
MPSEVSQYLINNPDGLYIDATFGGGGHSKFLLEKHKNIKIAAFDWDEDAMEKYKEIENLFGKRIFFIRDNFKNIKQALYNINIKTVSGILADIGVSSKQFDDMSRGFSFNSKVLDMRMDLRNPLTAKEVLNSYPEQELADIFYQYGQERLSRPIAKAIIERRRRGSINSAQELRDLVCLIKKPFGKIDPSTQVFQALRIFINGELQNLTGLLEDAPSLLDTNGRLVIISFHSLEDKIVKTNIKENESKKLYKNLTKKVITASYQELMSNPRSRSAKIRAAEKI